MTTNEDLVDELLTHDYDDERIHAAARALAESDRQRGLYAGFSEILRSRYPEISESDALDASGVGTLIETREQIDALPADTIVIAHDGTIACAFAGYGESKLHWSYFGTDDYETSFEVPLPVRVILLGVAG